MKYIRVTVGDYCENCYLLYNDNNEAVIIDPGADAERIIKYIDRYSLRPVAILLTHGHFDHIGAVQECRDRYGIPVYASGDEVQLLRDPALNSSADLGGYPISLIADYTFGDGEILPISGFSIHTLLTPGHTVGSACFYVPDMGAVFSGDTLFRHTVGRYDLPTGDGAALVRSLREKLFLLPPDTRVIPGHGLETVIGQEMELGTDDFL